MPELQTGLAARSVGVSMGGAGGGGGGVGYGKIDYSGMVQLPLFGSLIPVRS